MMTTEPPFWLATPSVGDSDYEVADLHSEPGYISEGIALGVGLSTGLYVLVRVAMITML